MGDRLNIRPAICCCTLAASTCEAHSVCVSGGLSLTITTPNLLRTYHDSLGIGRDAANGSQRPPGTKNVKPSHLAKRPGVAQCPGAVVVRGADPQPTVTDRY